jgi:L-ribulose-5-phosphate 4-epimerase
VAGHGPFTWGPNARASVHNAVALEAVAEMALASLMLDPNLPELESYAREKHFLRKHGANAYYGQK